MELHLTRVPNRHENLRVDAFAIGANEREGEGRRRTRVLADERIGLEAYPFAFTLERFEHFGGVPETEVRDGHRVLISQAGITEAMRRVLADNRAGTSAVIGAVERVTGRPVAHRISARRPGDPAVLFASAVKARTELGWAPRHSLADTLLRSGPAVR